MRQSKLPAVKSAMLTLVFLLLGVAFANQSCKSTKLPAEVINTVSSLGVDVPKLLNQATGQFTPSQAATATKILDQLNQASTLTAGLGGKVGKVSGIFNNISKDVLMPFLDLWKKNGTVDTGTINKTNTQFNDAMNEIKKLGKIK